MSSYIKRESRIGFLLCTPCLLFIITFIGYPLFRNIFLSFHDYNPLHSLEVTFSGLENYQWLVKESIFINSLYITILFTIVSVTLEAFIGFFVAYFLVKIKERFTKWGFRLLTSVFIIPYVMPTTSTGVAWRMLFHPSFGVINSMLNVKLMWLSDPILAFLSIVIADVWKTTPFFIFILLAGLISVPTEQYEAARIDGASGWQELRYITMPSILHLWIVTSVFRAIDAFTKIFDIVYILTGGGPGRATEVLPLLIYKTALRFFRFGTASALGVVAILISLFFGIGLLRRRT